MKTVIAFLSASVVGLAVALILAMHARYEHVTPVVQSSPARTIPSVVWEGHTWNCQQVNQWFARYGAYEPDGTPIPYEVVALCRE